MAHKTMKLHIKQHKKVLIVTPSMLFLLAFILKYMLIIVMLGFQFTFTTFVSATAFYLPNIMYKPPEQSREELYQDIFISLMLPYIESEVDKYYSKYLIQHPMVAPYTVYVLSAERSNGY